MSGTPTQKGWHVTMRRYDSFEDEPLFDREPKESPYDEDDDEEYEDEEEEV